MISDYHVEVEKVPSRPGCWDGSKEIIEKEFENDELSCRCE